jgi:hypothetical protein
MIALKKLCMSPVNAARKLCMQLYFVPLGDNIFDDTFDDTFN